MENLKKEFITYEQALALKQLGFDEPCFGYYRNYGTNKFYTGFVYRLPERFRSTIAPTFSQSFRFFREKYNIDCCLQRCSQGYVYQIYIKFGTKNNKVISQIGWCDKYEEAESTCLDKLIEIIKQNKDE